MQSPDRKVGEKHRWNCFWGPIRHQGLLLWTLRHTPKRLLALVNVALIPYVWIKFPKEARAYTRASFRAVLRGR